MTIIRKDPGTVLGQNIIISDIVSLKNPGFNMDNGNIYTLKLISLESAVLVNGVKWARSNIIGPGGGAPMRFSSDNRFF